MNKGELIDAVASEMKTTKSEASKAVDAVIDSISRGLTGTDKVSIAGFGTFQKKQRSARTGINPSTKEPMQIGASTTCSFKPSPALREQLD